MTMPAMPGPGESIQRMQTVHRVFTDQHGRKFEAQCDIRNNRPKEELRPIGCMPPWLPTMRFIWWDADNQFTFRWAYRQLANELASHTATWYSNARKMAVKEKLEIPEVGGDVHQLIRDVFGNPGLSPEVPLSAELGDPWLLYGDDFAPRNQDLFRVLNQGMQMQSNEALDLIEARVRMRMGLGESEPTNPPVPEGIIAQAEALQRGGPRRTIVPVGPQHMPVSQADQMRQDIEASIRRSLQQTPATAEPRAATTAITYNAFAAECRASGMKAPDIGTAWREHKEHMKEATVGAVLDGVG